MHFILKRLCLFILSGVESDKIMHPGYPSYIKKSKVEVKQESLF